MRGKGRRPQAGQARHYDALRYVWHYQRCRSRLRVLRANLEQRSGARAFAPALRVLPACHRCPLRLSTLRY